LQKRGRILTLPLLLLAKLSKVKSLYLVLVPSSFFSIGAPPGWSAGAFISPLGAAGSAGAGAGAAGAGGGGGGAGSSFLPHPAKIRVKAKRLAPDNRTILFPILSSPPFPTHLENRLARQFLLHNFQSLARGLWGHRGILCIKFCVALRLFAVDKRTAPDQSPLAIEKFLKNS
jgi:hypothetical protein